MIFTEDERFCISNILDKQARNGKLTWSEVTPLVQKLERNLNNVLSFNNEELEIILDAVKNDLKILKSFNEYNGPNVDMRRRIIKAIEKDILKENNMNYYRKRLIEAYKGTLDYKKWLDEDGILEIPEGMKEISESEFWTCTDIKGVVLPSSMKKVGKNAFSDTYVSTVELNEGLEEIEDGAFRSNVDIDEVEIPSSVRKISNRAFSHCRKVYLPATVEYIGKDAFGSFYKSVPTKIYFDGSEEDFEDISFENKEDFMNIYKVYFDGDDEEEIEDYGPTSLEDALTNWNKRH